MYYYIEPMSEEDIEHVQAVERQSFSTLWSANTYRSELRNPATSRYIVARVSQKPPPPQEHDPPATWLDRMLRWLRPSPPVARQPLPLIGYAGLWLNLDEGHITTIAVASAYRGKGIGELLMNHLFSLAMDLGADVLTLEVRVSNQTAQQLYLKYGFKAVGKRVRYYTDNGEDALIMTTDSIRTAEFQRRLADLRDQLYYRLRVEAGVDSSTSSSSSHPKEA